jgi:hypothetical protein
VHPEFDVTVVSRYDAHLVRLSRDDIVRALEALARELGEGEPIELALAGGAALVLMYGAREATKDVDAIILAGSAARVRAAAERVAGALGLPATWLNDAAKGYVHGLAPGAIVFSAPSLVARALAAEQLLAMKLSAWRDDVDIDDARLLLSKLSGAREEIWRRVEPHVVPGRELKARYAFDDIWEVDRGSA